MYQALYDTSRCIKCGKCCECIVLFFNTYDILFRASLKNENPDFKFAKRNFIEISEQEAFKINPYLKTWRDDQKKYYYKCKQYDDRTKMCMVHSIRPKTCSLFPYYDNGIAISLYSQDCIFNKDIIQKI